MPTPLQYFEKAVYLAWNFEYQSKQTVHEHMELVIRSHLFPVDFLKSALIHVFIAMTRCQCGVVDQHEAKCLRHHHLPLLRRRSAEILLHQPRLQMAS